MNIIREYFGLIFAAICISLLLVGTFKFMDSVQIELETYQVRGACRTEHAEQGLSWEQIDAKCGIIPMYNSK